MRYDIESTTYLESILSDLKITLSCLRDTIFKLPVSNIRDRLLFHINEAMNLDSVRDLPRIQYAFLSIKNIVQQENMTGELLDFIDDIYVLLDEVFEAVHAGKKL